MDKSTNKFENSSQKSPNIGENHIEKEMAKTITSIFKFSRFTTEFSKWVSLVMVLCWVLTLIAGWISFYIRGTYPIDVLEYVKEPVLIVLGFYYSTKMVENVSKGVCSYLNKKLNINTNDNYQNEII